MTKLVSPISMQPNNMVAASVGSRCAGISLRCCAAANICAAATIIHADGHAELVKIVGDRANFIKLADVTDGPLMDWMLTSGFTKEEIVAIQAPMVYTGDMERRLQEQERVNEQLRLAETARLKKVYKTVERSIVKNEKKSLELAVDRLMANPSLAWKLLDA